MIAQLMGLFSKYNHSILRIKPQDAFSDVVHMMNLRDSTIPRRRFDTGIAGGNEAQYRRYGRTARFKGCRVAGSRCNRPPLRPYTAHPSLVT